MYEVDFSLDATNTTKALKAANVLEDSGVDAGIIQTAITVLNGNVFNCTGSPPVKPTGSRPSYSMGARGPTPNVNTFNVDSIGFTWNAQLVPSQEVGKRHYLPIECAQLFDCLAMLSARRPDLVIEFATIDAEVRRLLEQNDPGNSRNIDSAVNLYSAIDHYPKLICVAAGGDDSGFSATFDVLVRPRPVRMENYLGASKGAPG